MTLTKTEYLLFLKHKAWLWLKKYDKSKLPPIDANTQAVFDSGNKLEAYAEQLFPEGTELGFDSYDEYQSLSQRTIDAINEGQKILFQARFDTPELTCLTDIVEFTSPTSLNLYEVKSSTKVKQEHEYDLAFQVQVLTECGYKVEKISVICVNNEYTRDGDIEPEKLLSIIDVTEKVVALEGATQKHIKQALKVINQKERPDISPRYARMGSITDWLEIYKGLTDLPNFSIYSIASPNAELFGELEDLGITLLQDIPSSITLNEKQARQVASIKKGQPIINKDQIKDFLDGLVYPLYFLDYETCMDVIPPYNGTKPYQQIPTQFSLHILSSPGEALIHKEYLHTKTNCPAHDLAKSLQENIGPQGSVLVWYSNFEMSRNREMAEMLPDFAEFFKDLNSRVVDLMVPFSEGMYIDPDFKGSASIKKVLPVLVPELSYKELDIQEGLTAQRLWMEAVLEDKFSQIKKEVLFHSLLKYCELDTLAMVRIYEKLMKL